MPIPEILLLASICFVAMLSPGPDFLLVAKNSLRHTKGPAFATAMGIVAGCLVHATYCMFGLALVITKSIVIFSILKYAGACYLIYLGLRAFLTKSQSRAKVIESVTQTLSMRRAFLDGFLCNVLNPKLAVFLLSLFTQFISSDATTSQKGIVVAVFITEATVYWPLLVLLLQSKAVKQTLSKCQSTIDKVCGALLLLIGVRVAFSQN